LLFGLGKVLWKHPGPNIPLTLSNLLALREEC
jgi:hypothetical protein